MAETDEFNVEDQLNYEAAEDAGAEGEVSFIHEVFVIVCKIGY